jgi:hypothetical protein
MLGMMADDSTPARAQAPEESAPVFSYMQKSFTDYDMRGGAAGKTRFTFHSEPLYHWTVQISGRNDGALFLWVNNGRPEIVGCVVTRPAKQIYYHEFHSLSQEPIKATLKGSIVWRPAEAGLQMQRVPDAPLPSSTATRRRAEMRSLARSFGASVVHQKDGTRWEARLLARPVHEYSGNGGDLLDGGLFLFVREGDPQLLLVLEACHAQSADQWQYGLARLSSNEISVEYERQTIRSIAKWPWRFQPTEVRPRDEPYAQFMMGTYSSPVEDGGQPSVLHPKPIPDP